MTPAFKIQNWALIIRPNAAGTALNVHRKGETASLALLYLNAPRTRRRDPALVAVAAAAIEAIGKAAQ